MMTAIPSPAPALAPVMNSKSMFSRRRVHCVGRNFAAHAVQIGRDMHSRALVGWPVLRGRDEAATLTITAV